MKHIFLVLLMIFSYHVVDAQDLLNDYSELIETKAKLDENIDSLLLVKFFFSFPEEFIEFNSLLGYDEETDTSSLGLLYDQYDDYMKYFETSFQYVDGQDLYTKLVRLSKDAFSGVDAIGLLHTHMLVLIHNNKRLFRDAVYSLKLSDTELVQLNSFVFEEHACPYGCSCGDKARKSVITLLCAKSIYEFLD